MLAVCKAVHNCAIDTLGNDILFQVVCNSLLRESSKSGSSISSGVRYEFLAVIRIYSCRNFSPY